MSMNKYLNEGSFQIKSLKKDPSKPKSLAKAEEREKVVSPCLKERKSMAPSRISIQKI